MYFISLSLLAASLPLSMFMMSVAQFALTGVMIIDGMEREKILGFYRRYSAARAIVLTLPMSIAWIAVSIVRKFKLFFSRDNIPAILFSSIYFIHIIGLLYSTDIQYALKDLRIKFPIFLLPLILSTTGRLTRQHFKWLMMVYIASVVVATLMSTWYYFTAEYNDIRDVSLFISHIRFSLMICIAIFVLAYWIGKSRHFSVNLRGIFLITLIWLVIYLIMVAAITGLIILLLTTFILIVYITFQKKRNPFLRFSLLVISLVFPAIIAWYFIHIVKDVYRVHPIDLNTLETSTNRGNPYYHDLNNKQVENGYYVWLYINEQEMQEAWNNRSELKYGGLDNVGQEIKYTLIRFLTSKGYSKDQEGVEKLTDKEVKMIEDGNASILYVERNALYVRLYKIIWEYKRYEETGNPSGHSVMQRLEYWKASWAIIKDNWVIGVGTGDLNIAFDEQYKKMNTMLDSQFRWRAHDQFLAIFVGLGVIGLAFFLLSLLYPPIYYRRFADYYYLTFFIILLISMIPEDTIESQAGVTLYAFFSSLYLFAKSFHDPI